VGSAEGADGTNDGKLPVAALELGAALCWPPESKLVGELLGKALEEPDQNLDGILLRVGPGELDGDLDGEKQPGALGEPSSNPSVCDQIKS